MWRWEICKHDNFIAYYITLKLNDQKDSVMTKARWKERTKIEHKSLHSSCNFSTVFFKVLCLVSEFLFKVVSSLFYENIFLYLDKLFWSGSKVKCMLTFDHWVGKYSLSFREIYQFWSHSLLRFLSSVYVDSLFYTKFWYLWCFMWC